MDVGRRRRFFEALDRRRQGALALERQAAGDHFVDYDAEGVEVGRRGDGAALDLLRRHVGRGADDAGAGHLGGEAVVRLAMRLGPGAVDAHDARRGEPFLTAAGMLQEKLPARVIEHDPVYAAFAVAIAGT